MIQRPLLITILGLIATLFSTEVEGQDRSAQKGSSSANPKTQANTTSNSARTYETREIQGWMVHIESSLVHAKPNHLEKAIPIFEAQLKAIREVVPQAAVAKLQQVPLWLSPEYPNIPPRAEYHPSAQWLRENHRDPNMARGVEFTDLRMIEDENRRMPWFVLHELAHAYHDQFIAQGNDNPELRAAFERAQASQVYERVQQRDARQNVTIGKAYAMTNVQEYFAELSEAYFGQNDFFPFTKNDLERVDPLGAKVLHKLWFERDAQDTK